MLLCQVTMLTTRTDFPGGERGYTCEAGKVACVVSGPGMDEGTVEMVCGECCERYHYLGGTCRRSGRFSPADPGLWGRRFRTT